MITHVLACGLCSRNPHAGENWLGVLGLILLVTVAGFTAMGREEKRKRAGLPPRQPADISPRLAMLASGRNHVIWTYPVRAVTPSGTVARMPRCCPRGHLTADLARAHAEDVARRIAATGR